MSLPLPPYPADTVAGSYCLKFDAARIAQSTTWKLAGKSPELRPWCLMLWYEAWQQRPVASLPNDDEVIAAIIGMPLDQFSAQRKVLLRGWTLHADQRLYHTILTDHALAMLRERKAYVDRQNRHRKSLTENASRVTPPMSPSDVDVDVDVKHSVGTVESSAAASSSTPTRRTKGTRLGKDWKLPDEWQAWATTAHNLDPQKVVRISLAFRDYWISVAGNKGLKLDWGAVWRNWIRKETGND